MKLVSLAACSIVAAATLLSGTPAPGQTATGAKSSAMDTIAEQYVKLVLALGQHDKDYVDAYYGPPEWKKDAAGAKVDLDTIASRARALATDVGRQSSSTQSPSRSGNGKDDEMMRLRVQYLERQLSALSARVRMLKGERLSFDDESRALYDAVAPTFPESHFQQILDRLEKRFPGKGPLAERYDAFRRSFVIPREKLDPVFQRAIQACRERTLQHVTLPPEEKFAVEYVTNKSWSGYNWYRAATAA